MTPPPAPDPARAAGAAFCAACGSPLGSGARFCHRCGTPAGQGAPLLRAQGGGGGALPWAVAFVALLSLVAMMAGKNFGASKGSGIDGSANSLPTQALDGAAPQGPPPGAGGEGGGPAPNIANLSPSERANRLYVRIMSYAEAGVVDSVAFFAPMAMASHEMLQAPTADERYHFGRIAEVANVAEVARAQADTILQGEPANLLGLLLGARAARMTGDQGAARRFDQRFLAALQAGMAAGREEYELHRADIDRAAEDARKGK